jgi:hypothetical protein
VSCTALQGEARGVAVWAGSPGPLCACCRQGGFSAAHAKLPLAAACNTRPVRTCGWRHAAVLPPLLLPSSLTPTPGVSLSRRGVHLERHQQQVDDAPTHARPRSLSRALCGRVAACASTASKHTCSVWRLSSCCCCQFFNNQLARGCQPCAAPRQHLQQRGQQLLAVLLQDSWLNNSS